MYLAISRRARLLQATIDSAEAAGVDLGDGRWRIALVSRNLPQRLEVAFAGQAADLVGDRQRFHGPTLANMAIERTLWTVHAPRGAAVDSPQYADPGLPSLERLRAASAILVRLDSDPSNEASPEARQIRQRWRRRFALAMADVRRQAALAPAAGRSVALREADTLRQEQAEIAQRHGDLAAFERILRETQASEDVSQLPAAAVAQAAIPRNFAAEDSLFGAPVVISQAVVGGRPSLALRLDAHNDSDQSGRIALAVALALAWFPVVAALRWASQRELVSRWPHWIGVLAGLAWWLWLAPSALGLLIVALSLAAAYICPFVRRPLLFGG